ncbi:MAG: Fe-Mn family superoxide dismutase [Nitrospirota bacterium]|nr:Fe-Mn family superoxide dismutase [Nitrospirota bacterium]
MKEYSPKVFDHISQLPGFSEQSVRTHLALYQGYVNNTNLLAEILREWLAAGKSGTIEWAEMKRRFAWEFNGMRLHEYYFENLTATATALDRQSQLYHKIEEDFGPYELWERGFKGTGGMRGIGWVILAYDVQTGRLFNVWLGEHDTGLLVDTRPLLVMDLFEHAFLLDYGLKRKDYEEAFFNVIDWGRVEKRLAACLKDQPIMVGEEVAEIGYRFHN